MSFVPRRYEEIVRDLLTTLTGGTVRETLVVPPGEDPIALAKLRDRPVRRISHLQGVTSIGVGDAAREIPYRFTAADFELVSSNGDESEKDAIRFRDGGRRPVPGSTVVVNYYPVHTDPLPLTDLNVGSVTRTLMESFARELALAYLQLEHVYDSAFLETAEGGSLDRVVALVGVRRLPPALPVARLRFSRQTGSAGRVTVPSGTAVTDDKGNRYLTVRELTLEPGEASREVFAAGDGPGTEPVEAGALNRLEVLVAGISEVTNPEPARRQSAPETDEQLRERARGALHGVVRGTVNALRFGLLSVPGVKSVTIVEAPHGVPGEVRLEISYGDDSQTVRQTVARTIDALRPAGVRVISGEAARKRVNLRVELTLAGTGLPPDELKALTSAIESRVAGYLSNLPPGATVRRAKLLALVLESSGVADARVVLLPEGEPEVEELSLETGQVLDVVRPFSFPAPATEEQPGAVRAAKAAVSLFLPVHLQAGVTLAEASAAIQTALATHLGSRTPSTPLTVDGLAAAIRDDSRYVLVRRDVIVTVESDGRFLQLTDGVGAYVPAEGETLEKSTVNVEPREGGA